MKNYIIITSYDNLNYLEAKANKLIKSGYEPIGGLARVREGIICQVMVRRKPPWDEERIRGMKKVYQLIP